jgi:predicted membrane channel-forming protein YqfA (hemolysin III family)
MEKQKIYEKTWFIILMLFLLAPVGIILLWREKKFNNIVRIILSILFGLVFLIAVMTCSPKTVPL